MFILLMFATLGLPILITFYILWQMDRLPKNRPANVQKQENKQVVVLAGDSITHGQIGENYVSILTEELGSDYQVVNAGVNSHLAWNLLERLDEIIKCEPNFITILIGTNDANAGTSKDEAQYYKKAMKLPRTPDRDWFRNILDSIIDRLLQETTARIAILSIPPIGEVPEHHAFRVSKDYAGIIKEVAMKRGVTYLPLQEEMIEFLLKHPGHPRHSFEKLKRELIRSVFMRYILRRTWNRIGDNAGFQLHIDYLHLNTLGAQMVVDLIMSFVRG